MTRHSGTPQRHSSSSIRHPKRAARLPLAAALVASLAAGFGFAGPATAQAVNGVVVDLSVIDGGVGAAPGTPFAGGEKLQLPPKANIRSRLYLKPKAMAAPMAAAPSSKPTMAAKPAPKPAAKTAAAPPQPISKPAPKPKVETAKVAPPKAPPRPPAPIMPKPATKDATAIPLVATAPPPPPPTTNAPPAPPATAAPQPPAPVSGETASAPANITVKPGRALRIAFDEGETKLPAGADADLNALANAIRDNKDYRVQLMAYAAAKDISTSKARRLSLSRALMVRSVLIDKGVRSTQIDVRALGNKTAEKPANRVDVNLAQR